MEKKFIAFNLDFETNFMLPPLVGLGEGRTGDEAALLEVERVPAAARERGLGDGRGDVRRGIEDRVGRHRGTGHR